MLYTTYLVPALTVTALLLVQWWLMRRAHKRQLLQVRERHAMAQKSAATLLQQARQQVAQMQQELQQARADVRRGIRPTRAVARPTPSRETRDSLDKLLDEAPARPAAPVDGFADTLPSRQFANSSTFGLLHRASTFAAHS